MSQEPEHGVIITAKDMYIELVRLRDAVGTLTPPREKLEDHEKRLRKVERWIWSLPSSLILSGTAIAVAYMQNHR